MLNRLSEEDTLSEQDLAPLLETFKALADETRLRLLGLVAERPYNGLGLAVALRISQPAVSHHVEKLRRAGLVLEQRDGKERLYSLNRERLATLARAQLSQAEHIPLPEDEDGRVLRDFFDGTRLRSIPTQRKKRLVILRHLLAAFEMGRDYPESAINEILRQAYEDVATLRREFIMNGLMTREAGIYRRLDPHLAPVGGE